MYQGIQVAMHCPLVFCPVGGHPVHAACHRALRVREGGGRVCGVYEEGVVW